MQNRRIGRVLLSLSGFCTGFLPVLADFNAEHTFSAGWSPHARFHGSATVIGQMAWAAIALWLLWSPATRQHKLSFLFATFIPLVYWGAFFPAMLVPTVALEDQGKEIPHLFGIPSNVYIFILVITIALLGYWFSQRDRTSSNQL